MADENFRYNILRIVVYDNVLLYVINFTSRVLCYIHYPIVVNVRVFAYEELCHFVIIVVLYGA